MPRISNVVPPKRGGRRKGKCRIATDTPKKTELEKDKRDSAHARKRLAETKRKSASQAKKKPKSGANSSKKACRRLQMSSSSESEPEEVVEVDSSDIEEGAVMEEEDASDAFDDPEDFQPLTAAPAKGDYVLVQFPGKVNRYFIALVTEEEDNEGDIEVRYLKKNDKCTDKYVLPDKIQMHSLPIKDVKMILPAPPILGSTRQRGLLHFPDEVLSLLNIG